MGFEIFITQPRLACPRAVDGQHTHESQTQESDFPDSTRHTRQFSLGETLAN